MQTPPCAFACETIVQTRHKQKTTPDPAQVED